MRKSKKGSLRMIQRLVKLFEKKENYPLSLGEKSELNHLIDVNYDLVVKTLERGSRLNKYIDQIIPEEEVGF